ncbi:cobalamin (5'-phosphate) synthase [Roseivivax halodurans JCM 10272]|uniref:Adenosylcobinamide-GDP ribazoletransferase n=1 Tax=Roseivivax halodurans JCM 10272 TaxID=1449350 RepID=X7EC69_9RHOB|nr:cobalamin (5'-phosphate) synthase [Roseivivax halodurans JCM 10272]
MRRRVAELQVAVMLLTRFPAGRLPEAVPSLSRAQWAYPLVGLPVGLVCWVICAGSLQAGIPEPVAAMLFLVTNALITGALHHDGLADFADGVGGGRDAVSCLAIMRDSRIGSYGVIALILALGCQAASLSSMGPVLTLLPVLAISVSSRLAMLGVMQILPPARGDGLGHLAGGGTMKSLCVGCGMAFALLVGAGLSSAMAVLASMAAVAVVILLAWRRIGGYTGDVLGAALVAFETVAFISLAGSTT